MKDRATRIRCNMSKRQARRAGARISGVVTTSLVLLSSSTSPHHLSVAAFCPSSSSSSLTSLIRPSGCSTHHHQRRKQHHLHTATILDSDLDTHDVNVNGLTSASSKATSNAYSAQQITVLSGLEPVRKRPGMYIGSTGPDGLHHLVYEVLDNSVDEALAGHATLINVILHDGIEDGENGKKKNCCTIIDDGRGIPTDLHPTTQISALETVLTVLHAGGKFDNAQDGSGYKVSGGLHGVGISVVNALSEFVEVRVDRKRGGSSSTKKNNIVERKMMRFERGVPVGQLKDVNNIDDEEFVVGTKGWEGIVFQTNDQKARLSLGDDDDDDNTDSPKGKGKAKSNAKSTSQSTKKQGKSSTNEKDSTSTTTLEYKTSLVQSLSAKRSSGTIVTFLPDMAVFKGANGKPGITFDESRLAMRMDEIAYLNAGLVLTLQDKRSSSIKRGGGADKSNVVTIFHHAGGLAEYADFLCRGKTPLFGEGSATTSKSKGGASKAKLETTPVVGLTLSPDGTTLLFHAEIKPTSSSGTPQTPIAIDAALRYTANSYNEQILSFVNNIRTRDGGSHVEGLKSCLTRTLNQSARRLGKLKEGDGNLAGDFIREGLTAIISVSVSEPEFEGQTKGRLGNPEVRPAVEAALGGELNKFFDFHPEILNVIFENASRAAAAAAAAKAAREVVRKKTLLQSTVLPGKLADCKFLLT